MAPSGAGVGWILEGQLKNWTRHLLVSSVTNMQSPSPLRQELQLQRIFFFFLPLSVTWNILANSETRFWITFSLPEHSSSGEHRTCTAGGRVFTVIWLLPAAGSLLERGFGQSGLDLAGVICGVSWNVGWEHKEGSNYKTENADSGLTKKESAKNERAVPQSTGEFECSQIDLALLIREDQLTDPKLLTYCYPGHPAPSPTILHTIWIVWFACAV